MNKSKQLKVVVKVVPNRYYKGFKNKFEHFTFMNVVQHPLKPFTPIPFHLSRDKTITAECR